MHARFKPLLRQLLWLVLVAALIGTATPASATPNETYYQAFNCPARSLWTAESTTSMTTNGSWNFRIAPETGSCTWIRTLAPGTSVERIAVEGWWSYVRITSTGEEGWIHSFGLRSATLAPPGPPTGYLQWAVNGSCSILVDSSIVTHVAALLTAAHDAGYRGLCGSGWRASDRQIAFRRQNCGTSYYAIYHMPSWQCSPPTAIPGTSNHERGLAIDFYTDYGASITWYEFNWLAQNAARYGLKNLPSERWHWSTNGR